MTFIKITNIPISTLTFNQICINPKMTPKSLFKTNKHIFTFFFLTFLFLQFFTEFSHSLIGNN